MNDTRADLLAAVALTRGRITALFPGTPGSPWPAPEPGWESQQQAMHCLWMLEQAESWLVTDGTSTKANRWLGFVQGWLWTTNLATIEEMRDWNRPVSPVARVWGSR